MSNTHQTLKQQVFCDESTKSYSKFQQIDIKKDFSLPVFWIFFVFIDDPTNRAISRVVKETLGAERDLIT